MLKFDDCGFFVLRVPLLPRTGLSLSQLLSADKSSSALNDFAIERQLFSDSVGASSARTHEALLNITTDSALRDSSFIATLEKYFKRASCRTSPYAFFASSSFGVIGRLTDLDQSEAPNLRPWCVQLRYTPSNQLRINPTLYWVGQELRFYAAQPTNNFSLVSIERTDWIDSLLSFVGKSFTMLDWLRASTLLFDSGDEARSLLEELLLIGLVVEQSCLPKLVGHFDARPSQASFESLRALRGLSRECYKTPTIRKSLVAELAAALQWLALGSTRDPYCANFEERFLFRFGCGEQVPLLVALDPEVGIWPSSNTIASQLGCSGSIWSHSYPWLDDRARDWDVWDRQRDADTDSVDTVDMESPRHAQDPGRIVTAIVALVTRQGGDEEIWLADIDYTSGFGPLSQSIATCAETRRHALAVVGREKTVLGRHHIKAEIVHAPTKKSSVIAQRSSIYPFEIQLFATGASHGPNIIDCSELSLVHREGRLQLWCERLSSEIHPEQSVPLSFANSRLPVYKFLCHFQRYGGRSLQIPSHDGNLRTHQDADYAVEVKEVPHLAYGKVRLRRCQWTLQVRRSPANPASFSVLAVFALCGIDPAVVWRQGDSLLELDLTKADDANLLLKPLAAGEKVLLEESAYSSRNSPLKWTQGEFANQLLIPLRSTNAWGHAKKRRARPPPYRIGPQTDVASVEAFLDVGAQNDMLIAIAESCSLARNWFFIRYGTPFPHLRIRLVRRDAEAPEAFRKEVAEIIRLCRTNCWKVRIAEYHPEDERFGGGAARCLALSVFRCHSAAAVACLATFNLHSAIDQVAIGSITALRVLRDLGLAFDEQCSAVNRLRLWAIEASTDRDCAMGELSQLHRQHGRELFQLIDHGPVHIHSYERHLDASTATSRLFAAKLLTLNSKRESLVDVVSRVLHLWLNRLFTCEHLLSEAACYDTLGRYWRRHGSINKRGMEA